MTEPTHIARLSLAMSDDVTIGVLSIDGVPVAVMVKPNDQWCWFACGKLAMAGSVTEAFSAARDAVSADLYRRGGK